jgi:hypothetical protein
VATSPLSNHLLSALPREDYERLAPGLQFVQMNLGHALYESGSALHGAS